MWILSWEVWRPKIVCWIYLILSHMWQDFQRLPILPNKSHTIWLLIKYCILKSVINISNNCQMCKIIRTRPKDLVVLDPFGQVFGWFWTIFDVIGPISTNMDHSVYWDPSFCTRLFGPGYLDLSSWICLLGLVYWEHVSVDPSIWTRLFGHVSLDTYIGSRMFGPIYLEPSILTRLFGLPT